MTSKIYKRFIAIICAFALVLGVVPATPFVTTAKASSVESWSVPFGDSGQITVQNNNSLTGGWGLKLQDPSNANMIISGSALGIKSTSDKWKAFYIETGTAIGGSATASTDGTAFKALAGVTYTVSFNAWTEEASSGKNMRYNKGGGTSDIPIAVSTEPTQVSFTFTPTATNGNLEINTNEIDTNVWLFISDLQITWTAPEVSDDPYIENISGTSVYDMQDELNTDGAFTGATVLSLNGSPTATVVDCGTSFSIEVDGGRSADWHALAINTSQIITSVDKTYTVYVLGRTENSGTTMKLCNPDGATTHATKVSGGDGKFKLEKNFTQLPTENIVIQTQNAATDKYYVDQIVVIEEPLDDTIYYDMLEDNNIKNAASGTALSGDKLIKSGSATFTIEGESRKSILVSGRTADHDAIDIKPKVFTNELTENKTYIVKVVGRADVGATVKLTNASYGTIGLSDTVQQEGTFEITAEITYSETAHDRIRIQTESATTTDLYIDYVVVAGAAATLPDNPALETQEVILVQEGFEGASADYANWDNGTSTLTVDTSIYYGGAQSLKVSGRDSSEGKTYHGSSYKATSDLEPGGEYKVSVWVYSQQATTFKIGGDITWADATSETNRWPSLSNTVAIPANTWTEVSAEYTLESEEFSSYKIVLECLTAGQDYYIDDFTLVLVAEAEEPEEEYELILEEGFEGASADYAGWGRGTATLTVDTAVKHGGNQSLKVSGRGNDTYHGVSYKATSALEPEGKYKVSVWVYSQQATTFKIGGSISWMDNSSASNKWPGWSGVVTIPANTWTEVSAEHTLSSEAFASYEIALECLTVGQDYYIDDFALSAVGGANDEELEVVEGDPFTPIDFEDQTLNGFTSRGSGGSATLAISNDTAHGGDYSLKVTNRSDSGQGPLLTATDYVTFGQATKYEFSLWVRIAEDSVPSAAELHLSTAITTDDGTSYQQFGGANNKLLVTKDQGWVQLKGTYTYPKKFNKIEIYLETKYAPTSAHDGYEYRTASFYIDDVNFVEMPPAQWDLNLASLKDAYSGKFQLGNILEPKDLENENTLAMFEQQYNVVTAENAMKPDRVSTGAAGQSGSYSFTNADKIVDWAVEAGIPIHGHTLVWHSQSPDWLNKKTPTTPLTRAEAKENLESYIETVATHFGTKVATWDVVNEVFLSGGGTSTEWKDNLRQKNTSNDAESSYWYLAYANGADESQGESGADYIYDSFVFARQYAPHAVLYYNDFNEEIATKRDSIANMIEELNEKWENDPRNTGDDKINGRLLIEGMGMQSHYNSTTSAATVEQAIQRFLETGVEISVSELDITFGNYNTRNTPFEYSEEVEQAQLYAQLFQIYDRYVGAGEIVRVTLWGKDDLTNWRYRAWPTLFDGIYQPKQAYHAVMDPYQYLIDNPTTQPSVPRANAMNGTPTLGTNDPLWNTAQAINVNTKPIVQSYAAAATAVVRTLWDSQYFYARAVVTDANLDKSSSEKHEQDSVEFFLSETMHKQGGYTNGDGQYRVSFEGIESFKDNSMSVGFESHHELTDTGYILEIKIPFRAITPTSGRVVGFDVQINDPPPGSGRPMTIWSDLKANGYNTTENWGEIVLSTPTPTPTPTPSDGGSSGGSSTPTPTPTPKPPQPAVEILPHEGGEKQTTTIQPVINSNGVAVVTVPKETLNTMIDKAKQDKSAGKQSIIEIKADTSVTSDKVQFGFPEGVIESIAGDTEASVKVDFGNSSITFDSKALETIGGKASGGSVSIQAAVIPTESLSQDVQQMVGNRPVYDFTVIADGVNVSHFGGGKASISIPYTLQSGEKPNAIVVYYYDDHTGKVTAVRCKYNPATKSVDFTTTHFSVYAIAYNPVTFSDVSSDAWYSSAVDFIAARGITVGVTPGYFAPDSSLTRGQFIVMLMRAYGIESDEVAVENFDDAGDTYYTNYLSAAKRLGITSGIGNNKYAPDAVITRQEMYTMLFNALNVLGEMPSQADYNYNIGAYSDTNEIADWAKEAMQVMVGLKITEGTGNNKLSPKMVTTRANMAQALYKLLSKF